MEETIIKCDHCENMLNNKNFFIEVKEKNRKVLIDEKYHFCDRHCLIAFLTQYED